MAATAAQNAPSPAPTPFEHKLVKFDLEGHFHYTFTLDLELDLTDTELDKKFELEGVPLAGHWTCACRETEKTACRLLEAASWWQAPRPQPEANPDNTGKAFTGFKMTVSRSDLEATAKRSNGEYNLGRHRSYRVVFEMETLGSQPTSEAEVLIRRMPALDLAATPQNVRLFFPQHEADLWADSSFLSRSSPYFKTLLSSAFAEAVSVPSKRPKTRLGSATAAAADAGAQDFDDSDEETDQPYFEAHPPSQHERDELQLPYKEIQITKTAFTTYRAVLAYLRTGYIAFAPLSSTFFAEADAEKPTRASRIEAAVSSDPSLPYPVSPKSTFRLAHLLELDELQHLCLANFSKQLTIDCAPFELFSDTSVCYDAWRQVVLDFVVDNCDAVTASSAWVEMEGKVERDEVAGAAPIMLESFKRKPVKAS